MSIFSRFRLAALVLCWPYLTGNGKSIGRQMATLASRGLSKPMSLSAREIRMVCASVLTQAAQG